MVLREWTNDLFRQHTSDVVLGTKYFHSIVDKDWGAIHVLCEVSSQKTPLLDEGSRTVNTCTSLTSQVWPDGARYKGQWVRVAQLILLMSGSLDATKATAGCLWNVFLFCET